MDRRLLLVVIIALLCWNVAAWLPVEAQRVHHDLLVGDTLVMPKGCRAWIFAQTVDSTFVEARCRGRVVTP